MRRMVAKRTRWLAPGGKVFALAIAVAALASAPASADPAAQSRPSAHATSAAIAQAERTLEAMFRAYQAGDYPAALTAAEAHLEAARNAHGAESSEVSRALSNLGLIRYRLGDLDAAEGDYRAALAMAEATEGPSSLRTAITLNGLAGLLNAKGKGEEALASYQRSLAIMEAVKGPEDEQTAVVLDNLAQFYMTRDRFADAEAMLRRALTIKEKVRGPDHEEVAYTLSSLGALKTSTGQHAEAADLTGRALAIFRARLGPEHPVTLTTQDNLATTYQRLGRPQDGLPLARAGIIALEKRLGPKHPTLAIAVNNIAQLYEDTGDVAGAEAAYRRAEAIFIEGLGPDHPRTAIISGNLSSLLVRLGRHEEAVETGSRATRTVARYVGSLQGPQSETVLATASTQLVFLGQIGAAHALAQAHPDRATEMADEAFQMAQWSEQNAAAQALARLSERYAAGDPALAERVRQRQDLAAARIGLDQKLAAALGQGQADELDRLRSDIRATDKDIAAIDANLSVEFPQYSRLSASSPLTIAEAQTLLRDDEALVKIFTFPAFTRDSDTTFVFVITRDRADWRKLPLSAKALRRTVIALRCGLDATMWAIAASGANGQAPEKPLCQRALNTPFSLADARAGQPLPFDLPAAHQLYAQLLAPFSEQIADKTLLVNTNGPLGQLPFGVLLTAAPQAGQKADDPGLSWLGASQPLAVLPSVSSLVALRKSAAPAAADKPFLGIGNPLLTGADGQDRRAFAAQACPVGRSAKSGLMAQLKAAPIIGALFRATTGDGIADPAVLRRQVPLPETTDELCAVADSLGAPETDLLLGAGATEAAIKGLDASGALGRYRVVHFATHGLVAGNLRGLTEPALLLTPPERGTTADDGLLTASEVASLRMNADWVVLSACNTAAGDSDSAEALSGLTRAFFYAGARSLLVSHWEVNSEAAVALTTGAFDALARATNIGRAEALRQAIAKVIAFGPLYQAHPSYWAPFILVGEAGPVR